MSEVTNLRQTDAKMRAVGVITEIDLKGYDKTGKTEVAEGETPDVIKGNVSVKVDDINTIPFQVYVNRLTKEGKENSQFKGIQTVMREYKSIAQVGADEATRISASGNLGLQTFKGGDGQIKEGSIRFNGSFFNRVKADSDVENEAKLDIEIFIRSFVPEMVNGEETGRVLVNGWTVMYHKDKGVILEPVTLVAPVEDGIADAISSTFEMGQTVRFFCDVINSSRTITKTIPVAIGKPKTETHTEFKQEFVITGATAAYEEDNAAALNPDAVKAAMNVRTEVIEELKAKDTKPATTQKAKKSTQVAQW